MRAIFYAPIADPDAGAASGVQRMGALLQRALEAAGVELITPRLPRTFDGRGDAELQETLRRHSEHVANELLAAVRNQRLAKPDVWFSYHVYYKSPDWIGPTVAKAWGIPYIVAEGSHAPKRSSGPWALAHEGTTQALKAADRLLAMTSFDRVCLDQLAPARVRDLKPFIDPAPFSQVPIGGDIHNTLFAVGMMRNDRKYASYDLLAAALRLMSDIDLIVMIAGDGVFRQDIEAMFTPKAPKHVILFLGAVTRMPMYMGSCILAWPGIGEAYGLVFLEAQAAGVPIVACRDRGVPDAMVEGETGLLSEPGDAAAYAANLRRLLSDRPLRERFGRNGRAFVQKERSIDAAASTLRGVFAELGLS